ncbi:hypothetical protein Ciccas_011066 [Cichlidogyrus casuarinus]|uniref:Uncharacterized protein n=1 Tax=Cichlidogyrus casuarinus TaxID=1844966 RepID=A0ABD2PX11_9PLAT
MDISQNVSMSLSNPALEEAAITQDVSIPISMSETKDASALIKSTNTSFPRSPIPSALSPTTPRSAARIKSELMFQLYYSSEHQPSASSGNRLRQKLVPVTEEDISPHQNTTLCLENSVVSIPPSDYQSRASEVFLDVVPCTIDLPYPVPKSRSDSCDLKWKILSETHSLIIEFPTKTKSSNTGNKKLDSLLERQLVAEQLGLKVQYTSNLDQSFLLLSTDSSKTVFKGFEKFAKKLVQDHEIAQNSLLDKLEIRLEETKKSFERVQEEFKSGDDEYEQKSKLLKSYDYHFDLSNFNFKESVLPAPWDAQNLPMYSFHPLSSDVLRIELFYKTILLDYRCIGTDLMKKELLVDSTMISSMYHAISVEKSMSFLCTNSSCSVELLPKPTNVFVMQLATVLKALKQGEGYYSTFNNLETLLKFLEVSLSGAYRLFGVTNKLFKDDCVHYCWINLPNFKKVLDSAKRLGSIILVTVKEIILSIFDGANMELVVELNDTVQANVSWTLPNALDFASHSGSLEIKRQQIVNIGPHLPDNELIGKLRASLTPETLLQGQLSSLVGNL